MAGDVLKERCTNFNHGVRGWVINYRLDEYDPECETCVAREGS